MLEEIPTIGVIDDDDSVRRALGRLLTASGYQVRTFASATEFLEGRLALEDSPGCLLIDVRMPELGGLELQTVLVNAGTQSAIVFMTGHGDVQTGVKAMKSGAVDFLLKPFTDDDLLEAVQRALVRNAEMRIEHREVDELEHRAAKLTRREKEVCTLVVAGKLNKQIAAALGTSEKTVKVHRSRVMAKMEAASLAELVRIVERLNRFRASANSGNAGNTGHSGSTGSAGNSGSGGHAGSAGSGANGVNGASSASTARTPSPEPRREPNDSHDDDRRRLSGSTS